MFGMNPANTQADQLVTIHGLKTRIYQYQAFGVYWQMITSRSLGGGFVADDMGLGKTLSYLAYIVVERQLAILWRDVHKSRVENDNRHLTTGQHDGNDECPSQLRRGWIACPCASSSPTSKFAPQPGVRMACVPPALVATWWSQWKTHVDTSDSVMGLSIVVDHPGAFTRETPQADMLAKSDNARNLTRLTARPYGKLASERDGKGDDEPADYHEGYLLLTTKESYPKYEEKKFRKEGQIRDPKKPGEWKKGLRTTIIFGIAMIDESHEEYFRNKGRARILTELPRSNTNVRPFVWGYSGTPFSQTPRGLEGLLWAVEHHAALSGSNWNTNPRLRQFQWSRLDEICKKYDQQVKGKKRDDAAVRQILAEFKPFLLNFMLRRRGDTKWFGHSLIKLKPHIHQDIHLKMTRDRYEKTKKIPQYEATFKEEKEQLLEQLQAKWDDFPNARRSDIRPTKLAFNTMCRISWRSRVLSTIPWMLNTVTREVGPRMNLTEEETLEFTGSDAKEKASTCRRYIRNITEDSPKLLWLYGFVQRLDLQRDIDGNEQKLVILTQFPQVAFALKMVTICIP